MEQAKETLWNGWRAGEVGFSPPWALRLWAVQRSLLWLYSLGGDSQPS